MEPFCGVARLTIVTIPLPKPDIAVESDQELMANIAGGDANALGHLYLRHNSAVRSIIGYVAPAMNCHDVDDATQDVFLALGKAAKSYRHKSLFSAFLFRIATNRARDWQRRTWLRFSVTKKQQCLNISLSNAAIETGPGQKTILNQTVRQIVSTLSYAHREVLALHVIAGFTCEEIASMLEIKPKTVRTRLHRARNAILQNKKAPIWQEAISEKPL